MDNKKELVPVSDHPARAYRAALTEYANLNASAFKDIDGEGNKIEFTVRGLEILTDSGVRVDKGNLGNRADDTNVFNLEIPQGISPLKFIELQTDEREKIINKALETAEEILNDVGALVKDKEYSYSLSVAGYARTGRGNTRHPRVIIEVSLLHEKATATDKVSKAILEKRAELVKAGLSEEQINIVIQTLKS